MAALQLTMVRDKTGLFFLSVYQVDGVTPQSLVGATLYFHAAVVALGFTIDKSSPSGGITISNTAGGTDCATLQIDPADTAGLPSRVFGMPCELTMVAAGDTFELNSGTLTVQPNVGLP